MLSIVLACLLAGSLVYCVLTIIAAVRYRAVRPAILAAAPPISILKPLAGVDRHRQTLETGRQDRQRRRPAADHLARVPA